jgi:hypothetical protein
LWWRLADENAGKSSLHEGGGAPANNRTLQQSEPCFKSFAGPARERKSPSGKRPVSCANTSMILLSAGRLFLESVPKPDERSKVSKIEQTRCDRS